MAGRPKGSKNRTADSTAEGALGYQGRKGGTTNSPLQAAINRIIEDPENVAEVLSAVLNTKKIKEEMATWVQTERLKLEAVERFLQHFPAARGMTA
jgi:hypothetical protein